MSAFHPSYYLQSTLIEEIPVCPVPDDYSVLAIIEGFSEHNREHDGEEFRC